MGEPRIAFVSREVYPFDAAGLGNYVAFSAAALAGLAEVTILTSSIHERRYHELVAAGDSRLPPGVRFEFVAEPKPHEVDYWYTGLHLWSARAYEALVRLYPDGGPDLVEFPDYLGEGFVTAQARQTLDRSLRHTTVCARAYTTAEMCAVLNGYAPVDRENRHTFELERYALRHVDHFLWPGGDVLGAYHRFYGERAVAAPVQVGHVVDPRMSDTIPEPAGDAGGLRCLYVGRLERRKGVQNLVRAVSALADPDWSLTMIGGDTPTAPLGTSMHAHLALMSAGDPRIRLVAPVPREELRSHYEAADVCISPSLWECWPNTVLEALAHDRPVVATPVGGHLGMLTRGDAGWLSEDAGADALLASLEDVIVAARQRGARGGRGPRDRFDELTDPEPVRARYLELASARPSRSTAQPPAPRSQAPLVSIVIPYFRMERFVEETLASVVSQTYPRIETIVVNDGSLREEDAILEELAERYPITVVTQPNSGLGQARNLGVELAAGRYILPLDPDDELMPTYVARCVEVLEGRPEVGYVTAWSEFVDEEGRPSGAGYRPIGNTASWLASENVAGSAMAIFRRRLFEAGLRYSPDLTSYEDWLIYLELNASGVYGHVIPETLLRYRVRERSMLRGVASARRERLAGELEAHVREAAVTWTSLSV